MTTTEDSDLTLLTRSGAGDRAAFGQLYERHVRAVYWQAFDVVRQAGVAEEVTQDAFLTLWRKASTVHLVESSALPWLMVTARYLALNAGRRLQRDGLRSTTLDLDVEDETATVDRALASEEIRAQIDRAVHALGDLDRRLYALCIEQDHSYEAAARELGVSHGTVRNRLSRVRTRLRADLKAVKETS